MRMCRKASALIIDGRDGVEEQQAGDPWLKRLAEPPAGLRGRGVPHFVRDNKGEKDKVVWSRWLREKPFGSQKRTSGAKARTHFSELAARVELVPFPFVANTNCQQALKSCASRNGAPRPRTAPLRNKTMP
jgi:hypothetical protein